MLHIRSYTVVWPDQELVQISADLRRRCEAIGKQLTTADAWIAASAIYLDCPLASNDRDFSDIDDLELIRL